MTKLFNRRPAEDEILVPNDDGDLSSEVSRLGRIADALEPERLPPGDLLTEVYKRGRREWDDRIGDAKTQRDDWRRYAFGTLVILAVSVTGNIWQGTQSKIQVVTVERDRNLDVVAVRTEGQKPFADPAYVASDLKRWIVNVRTVYTDTKALTKGINDAYSLVAQNSPANQLLNEFYNKDEPFQRATKQTVAVTPLSAIPNSDNTPDSEGRITWRLEWREEVTGRDGSLIRDEPWVATVTFVKNDPQTSGEVTANPTGIFITHINWSRKGV